MLIGVSSFSAPATQFSPGQIWSVKSSSPTPLNVVIGRVEVWHGETAVHVSLINVPVPPDVPGGSGLMEIGHMPFAESALARSVDQLINLNVSVGSEFERGYKDWRSANGGIFTTSVLDAVVFVFKTLSGNRSGIEKNRAE